MCTPQAFGRTGFHDSKPPQANAAHQPLILWFRNDLRVHDNEALSTASANSSSVLPVYIFDPRDYGKVGAAFFSLQGAPDASCITPTQTLPSMVVLFVCILTRRTAHMSKPVCAS